MLAAPSTHEPVTEMPRCRTAIRNAPPPGESRRTVNGEAVLIGRQRSAKIGCGIRAELQAASVIAAIAHTTHRGPGKQVGANAAILSCRPVIVARRHRFLLQNGFSRQGPRK